MRTQRFAIRPLYTLSFSLTASCDFFLTWLYSQSALLLYNTCSKSTRELMFPGSHHSYLWIGIHRYLCKAVLTVCYAEPPIHSLLCVGICASKRSGNDILIEVCRSGALFKHIFMAWMYTSSAFFYDLFNNFYLHKNMCILIIKNKI